MNKLISIIIPVYNAEKSLKRSVDSLINQTYKNIEIILVNDGSIDNSAEICLNYQTNDSRVKYIYQKNAGVSSARNHGIKASKGDYIAFLDADDYLESQFCERMLKCLTAQQADICICRNYKVEQHINSDGEITENITRLTPEKKETFSIKSEEYDFYSMYSHWTVWGVLFKREVLEGLKFRKGLFVGEDTYYLSEAIKKADKIAFLNEFLIYYIIAPKSASHGDFNAKKYTELKSWRKIIHLFNDRPEQQKNIKATYAKRCLKVIKTYYCISEDFRNNYYKKTISEYRRNAVYAFRQDIKNKEFSFLVKHLSAYIAPAIMFKMQHMLIK